MLQHWHKKGYEQRCTNLQVCTNSHLQYFKPKLQRPFMMGTMTVQSEHETMSKTYFFDWAETTHSVEQACSE